MTKVLRRSGEFEARQDGAPSTDQWICRTRPEGRVLPVDAPVALCCARLHVPDPRPERDALIAATALVHGMTVVTRNVADFAPIGVPLLNPWQTTG
jgi:predicted nucleic acid-binding protein